MKKRFVTNFFTEIHWFLFVNVSVPKADAKGSLADIYFLPTHPFQPLCTLTVRQCCLTSFLAVIVILRGLVS